MIGDRGRALLLSMLLAGCATSHVALPGARLGPPVPRAGGIYHQVERGQTFWRIAQTYGVPLEELARVNALTTPQRISVGAWLWIPGATATRKITTPPVVTAGDDSFQWPLRGEVLAYFGSYHGGSAHRGMDIRAAPGTPVRTTRPGRVVFVDTHMPGYGKTVIIDHGDGFSSVYAWNGELLVQVGQEVNRSTTIATAGSSGRATGSALHFEIRRHHVPQNPFYFLP